MTLYAKTFPVADVFADQAIALSNQQPSLGLLNAIFGKAHAAEGCRRPPHRPPSLAESRRIFDRAGSYVLGDLAAHARAALDVLPPEKHSLTLRLLMAEVEQP
ncbi:hypothetical protein [Streptomyces sp. NPDC090112]|uniref:hypothetical protein n=1 Tax=Streptomyces sp. NPDC090112 TaxID=3365949 RepID=UPI00380F51A9